MISFDEFKKLDLRIGKVTAAEKVEGSEKLLKLTVDLGDDPSTSSGPRTIIAGIGQYYSPEEMANRKVVVVANLAPKTMLGLESAGMILAADTPEGPILLMPDETRLETGQETPAGAVVT